MGGTTLLTEVAAAAAAAACRPVDGLADTATAEGFASLPVRTLEAAFATGAAAVDELVAAVLGVDSLWAGLPLAVAETTDLPAHETSGAEDKANDAGLERPRQSGVSKLTESV